MDQDRELHLRSLGKVAGGRELGSDSWWGLSCLLWLLLLEPEPEGLEQALVLGVVEELGLLQHDNIGDYKMKYCRRIESPTFLKWKIISCATLE